MARGREQLGAVHTALSGQAGERAQDQHLHCITWVCNAARLARKFDKHPRAPVKQHGRSVAEPASLLIDPSSCQAPFS